jgi:translocator protein
MFKIFKVKGKFNLGDFIISLLISEGIGLLSGFLTMGYIKYFNVIKKPPITPPSIVFPIVWAILLFFMGTASYRIWQYKNLDINISKALTSYVIQLVLNFLWSIIFFRFQLITIAFIELIFLLFFIVLTTINFFKVDKVAGLLMISYLLWVIFAGYLNYCIILLNSWII